MFAKKSGIWIMLPTLFSILLFGYFFLYRHIVIFMIGCIFFIVSLFFIIFFRDPQREIGEGIVSPADGRIIDIRTEYNKVKISIFMNLFNVHVNRAPLDGTIVSIKHYSGKHTPAYSVLAYKNEKMITSLDTEIGIVDVVQISGIFARRIVCFVTEGAHIKKGERIGMIRFGSRVDLIMDSNKVNVVVSENDKVYAGKSTVAWIK